MIYDGVREVFLEQIWKLNDSHFSLPAWCSEMLYAQFYHAVQWKKV